MTNTEKLFEMILHAKNPETMGSDMTIEIGKTSRTLSPVQRDRTINRLIQAFFHEVGDVMDRERKVAIQAFSGSADLPALTSDVFTVTNEVPSFDTKWQAAFKTVTLLDGQLHWEIAKVESGMTLQEIPEGGKVRLADLAGETATVNIKKYATGLAVTWEMREGRKLYKFVDALEQARARIYGGWADVHYGLLATAASGNTVSYQGEETETQLARDIETINYAVATIGAANKDKGYGDTESAQYLMYARPTMKARLLAALNATQSEVVQGGGGKIVRFNVTPMFSWNSNLSDEEAILVLPKNKIQNAVKIRELGVQRQDILSLNDEMAYWTAYGAAVGDTDQCYEVAFADSE